MGLSTFSAAGSADARSGARAKICIDASLSAKGLTLDIDGLAKLKIDKLRRNLRRYIDDLDLKSEKAEEIRGYIRDVVDKVPQNLALNAEGGLDLSVVPDAQRAFLEFALTGKGDLQVDKHIIKGMGHVKVQVLSGKILAKYYARAKINTEFLGMRIDAVQVGSEGAVIFKAPGKKALYEISPDELLISVQDDNVIKLADGTKGWVAVRYPTRDGALRTGYVEGPLVREYRRRIEASR